MIRSDRDGDSLILTIDRPDKAGALTSAMLTELAERAEAARDVRLLILTGTGRVFSAGADLDAARAGLATDSVWERLSAAIAACRGLTIAALNGTAAGGALGMVLACDLRIAVAQTRFFYPVMRLGFLPQLSDVPRMVRLIGPARTKMILMAGQKIDAETALAWGLIDRIVPDDALLQTARALGQDVCAAAPDHATAIKQMIDRP
ncbi:MAG: enoyl-CoA hydratase/isomerase family protein [Loktanella sp.]|nr:enoyl-CoA hydratase/isomerase family protein [Loktanella sp.]